MDQVILWYWDCPVLWYVSRISGFYLLHCSSIPFTHLVIKIKKSSEFVKCALGDQTCCWLITSALKSFNKRKKSIRIFTYIIEISRVLHFFVCGCTFGLYKICTSYFSGPFSPSLLYLEWETICMLDYVSLPHNSLFSNICMSFF